jgi:outer membrane protein OmpA-like peptidoglycan-associated protein
MIADKMLLAGATFWAMAAAGGAAHAADAPAPDSIIVYFDNGSARMHADDLAQLDKAARLYRDGHPILMTVAAGADATGSPVGNLHLSQERADAVFQGLVARGIPADRFQIVAKGQTDPAVQADGQEPKNRRAEITWK